MSQMKLIVGIFEDGSMILSVKGATLFARVSEPRSQAGTEEIIHLAFGPGLDLVQR